MNRRSSSPRGLAILIPLIYSSLFTELSACQAGGTAAGSEQVRSAAGTATRLIQDAQSTVIVLKAQAMATALVETLNAPRPGDHTGESATPAGMDATPIPSSQATPGRVVIVAVTTAGEGAYIMVQFRAPRRLVDGWYQDGVSVTDESTGAIYAEIPSVGTIGLLIGRPRSDGQLGYVMLVNAPVPMAPGTLVTVMLGDFKQEHLKVR